jgi:hypothetical protein
MKKKEEIIKELYKLSVDLYYCVRGNEKGGHCGMMGFSPDKKYNEELSYLGGAIGNLNKSFGIIEKANDTQGKN